MATPEGVEPPTLRSEVCVCDIQHVLESSQPNVSRHLAYLKNSGLVLDRRDGLRIFYRLAEPKHGLKKKLFEFLQDAYKSDEELQEDIARLMGTHLWAYSALRQVQICRALQGDQFRDNTEVRQLQMT
jgi:ArsR family transcriptional regulator